MGRVRVRACLRKMELFSEDVLVELLLICFGSGYCFGILRES